MISITLSPKKFGDLILYYHDVHVVNDTTYHVYCFDAKSLCLDCDLI